MELQQKDVEITAVSQQNLLRLQQLALECQQLLPCLVLVRILLSYNQPFEF